MLRFRDADNELQAVLLKKFQLAHGKGIFTTRFGNIASTLSSHHRVLNTNGLAMIPLMQVLPMHYIRNAA